MQARKTTTRTLEHQSQSQLPSIQKINLLKHLIISNLPPSPISSLFFAERLYALDNQLELAVFLLAYCLDKNGRPLEAVHTLRQLVNWNHSAHLDQQQPDSAPANPFLSTSANATAGKKGKQTLKPAMESSLLCARLYAKCCTQLGRHKEARDVLHRALLPSTVLLSPPSDFSLSSLEATTASSTLFDSEHWVYELELARLARKGGEHERAIVSYRKALEGNAWCWEALEGLCKEGQPPDTDQLFPVRQRPATASPIINRNNNGALPASSSSSAAQHLPHASTSTSSSSTATIHHQPPPPLGPTQTNAINGSMVIPKGRQMTDALGFFTPGETTGAGGVNQGKGKGQWKKGQAGGKNNEVVEMMAMDDSNNSFESSFYPSQSSIPPLSFATSLQPASSYLPPSHSSSLFTPPPGPSLTAIAPGVKRPRGQQPPLTSTNEDESKIGRRQVRGVPATGATGGSMRRDTSVGGPTRRSSRISAAASTTSNSNSTGAPGSTSMAMSRSTSNRTTTSNNGTNPPHANVSTRDKKRTKNGAGPSVLSDAGTGSDILSPTSHSSSPVPSSPGQQAQSLPDPLVLEAEDYVASCLRGFGKAETEMSRFECQKAIDALVALLPIEQQKSWRCCVGIAKAQMEMLNYEKAEKAFSQARAQAPHLLESMELYSTLLWHLRSSTSLSFLAQDLMSIAPRSPSSWIAAGNVFSHLEDHSSALKCFKRAAQLDEGCVYSYTLSGHECVVLEEWERALGFFREAVRRDQRHYNAWFGLGNVYMQTGKYRLAEYHFRKAVEINPSNATLVCCIGTVLEKLGRRKDALELYERACVLAPESPAVRFKRVRILISLRQYKTAESDLLTLKDRAPNEFNVYFLLGKLYKALDRKPEMLKYFGLAQDLEPRTASLIRETITKEPTHKGGVDLDMEVDDLDVGTSERSGTIV